MKKRFKIVLAIFLAVLMLTATTPSAVLADESDTEAGAETEVVTETASEVAEVEGGVSLSGIHEVAEYKYNFETIFENDEAQLLIDKAVNNIRIVMKKSGLYYDTKVMNGQLGNAVIKNMQKSDFNIVYYKDKVRASTVSMDSQTMSVDLAQVTYEPINNGIRCRFTVGDGNRVQLTMFPMYISMERLEEFVLQYLDDRDRREFLNSYYTETKARVIRNWNTLNNDGTPVSVPLMRLRKMYEYFYEIGNYTAEELAIDNDAWGEVVEETSTNIDIVIDYMLDGTDLVVNVPCSEMVFNPLMPVSSITLNPYLMSADFNDTGYLFVPDGSGGIIEFNTGRTASNLSIPIYGNDALKSPYLYSEQFEQATLPVFGMQKNGYALLAIIENGAELATVSANIAGRVDEFNKTNVTFELQYRENAMLRSGRGQVMPQYLESVYSGDITMRYKLLENNDSGYVGMAKAYKEYLTDRGELKQNDVAEEAPFFAEFIATTAKMKMFLGVSYIENFSMTSTKETQNILSSLKQNGINNIKAQYTDWANGGIYSTPLKSINVMSSIGGKKGLTTLADYCEANGIGFHPSIALLQSYKTNGISKDNQARMINNTPAFFGGFHSVTRLMNQINYVLLAPSYWSEYASKISKNMDKLNLNGVALTDAGTLLYGDYNDKIEDLRTESVDDIRESLNTLGASMDVMLVNANSYAYKYADTITDLPFNYSGRRTVDYAIPFTQMVLENDIPYSMPAYNEDIMEWNGFEEYLLKAVESKSGLKFIFTEKDEKEFGSALQAAFGDSIRAYFMTKYSRWEDKIGDYYAAYNDFYQKVKNAEMTEHNRISKNFVKVGYSNGIEVYINYSDVQQSIDGITIEPMSFVTTATEKR